MLRFVGRICWNRIISNDKAESWYIAHLAASSDMVREKEKVEQWVNIVGLKRAKRDMPTSDPRSRSDSLLYYFIYNGRTQS
jgi:hypothetical protein